MEINCGFVKNLCDQINYYVFFIFHAFRNIYSSVSQPIKQKHQKMYKPGKVEDWTVGYGYGDLAGVETYPRRALLAGSTNALIVNLNISMADLDYACTSFQGFQVHVFSFIYEFVR